MLTVAKITQTGAVGYAEYLEARSEPSGLGDYYLKDGDRVEAPGRWAAGADRFGSRNGMRVSGDQLRALLAVRRPDTGEPLRPVGGNGMAVAAIDATFSAPKTVSAVWAIANPELRQELEAAHEAAVDVALGYAVGRVAMLRERRADRSVVHTTAAGVVATSWRHTTARAVAGQLPDPQLHSHVLLHGAVRRDGKVMAIDSRAWLVARREVGAAYRSHLACGLSRLGLDIRRGNGRDGRYFEIAGVPEGLVERWSSREHQIQAAITARLKDQERALEGRATASGPEASGRHSSLHGCGRVRWG